MAINLDQKGG